MDLFCYNVLSVHCSLAVTCMERANLFVLLYVIFFMRFCLCPMGCPGSGMVLDYIDS